MDNHTQPNGILPRPQSRSRPPPVPQQQQQPQPQMYDEDDDEDSEFGGGVGGGPSRNSSVIHERQRGRSNRETTSDQRVTRESRNLKETPKFLKVAIIGDSTVGKTCLCKAVTSDSYIFSKNYHLTCGVQVYPKSVKIPSDNESRLLASADEWVTMALLDSSGKNVYLEYLPKYWDELDAYLIVVDLTLSSSLKSVEEWLKLATSCCPKNKELGVLVGNKKDLTERRQISPTEAQELAKKFGLQYFECSVKENSGLEDPFFFLAHKWSSTSGTANKENLVNK